MNTLCVPLYIYPNSEVVKKWMSSTISHRYFVVMWPVINAPYGEIYSSWGESINGLEPINILKYLNSYLSYTEHLKLSYRL